jgi:hypothetical protein
MTDEKQGELDRILDAALAKYAAAPRAGLEDRVLTNLRAERGPVPVHAWSRWSVAAALAGIVVVAMALAWRSGESSHSVVTNHPAVATQSPNQPATQVASNRGGSGILPPELSAVRNPTTHRLPPTVAIAAQPKLDQPRLDQPRLHQPRLDQPKLDQFPSAQPLSEQEIALARYVSQFPQEATLIARAQGEYETEIQQQMKNANSETGPSDTDQPER